MIELAVKIGDAVRGVIIGFVIVFKSIPCHIGNVSRVTAGLVSDGRAGKSGTEHIAVGHAVKIEAGKHF